MAAMASPPPKLVTTRKILKEAINLPKTNPSLILSVFLISLLATYLYLSAFLLSTSSLLADLTKNSASLITADPKDPSYYAILASIQKDVKEITSVEVVFIIIGTIISYFVNAVTIYALAMTRAGKLLTLKELLRGVARTLKGPLLTQFLVTVLSAGYIVLLVLVVLLFWYISDGSMFLLALAGLLAFAALVWYLYLIALCYLSTTVSVVEQGCYGVGAIARAAELAEGRKWRQGFAIVVIAIILGIPVAVVYSLAYVSIRQSVWGQLGVGLVFVAVNLVLSLFVWAAFTVYYYECKRSHGEETNKTTGDVVVYTSLPTAVADAV